MRDIFDTHVHAVDLASTSDDIVRSMDANDVRMMCLIAPYKTIADRDFVARMSPVERMTAIRHLYKKNGRAANDWIARVASEKPDRIVPLAFVDSIDPDGPAELERAVNAGCRGLKLFNMGHYPWDERCWPLYEKAAELGTPILFHSGILGDNRNSRFHRPAEYEIVKQWPALKVVLAHLSWPWTDEAIATCGMGRLDGHIQIHLDLTPGAPLEWREDAERKAFEYLPDNVLLFGTDGKEIGDYTARVIREQDFIFDKLNIPADKRHKIYWQNACDFYGIS